MGIFAALPFILYGQLEKADRQTRGLVAESFRQHGWLIAQALATVLDRAPQPDAAELAHFLERFSEDGTILRLLVRPADASGAPVEGGFSFAAAAPPVPAEQTAADLDMLAKKGVLGPLSRSCSLEAPAETRYQEANGTEEILTAIMPISSGGRCWVLISANNSSAMLKTFGRPYWQDENIRMAALVYMLFAVLAVFTVLRVRSALRHFRAVAREIRRGGAGSVAFAHRNIVPELASAACDFDRLVNDLLRAASEIRCAAEENAHAVKTPLAIIRSALHPIKRALPEDDARAQRALVIIDQTLTRLTGLISTAQRLGNDTADFIEAPKLKINLTEVVNEALRNAQEICAGRGIRFLRYLEEGVHTHAPEGVWDIIIENILDNAISFSHDKSTIFTRLRRFGSTIELLIEDEGPGIDPDKIEHIFERNFSFRPDGRPPSEPEHAGLGLWIVRHHIKAMGGNVHASNRSGGGLCIHIDLPTAGADPASL